jgi:hypothetical protein
MNISKNGSWQNSTLEGHGFDKILSNSIVKICKQKKIKSLYDFGCGHGNYTKTLIENGFVCEGYDGNQYTEMLTDGLCKVLDLSVPFYKTKKDFVLCLEVGEHIPKIYEETLINNIHNHNTNGIIISWALVGQGGDGHINCQDNEYIKNILFLKITLIHFRIQNNHSVLKIIIHSNINGRLNMHIERALT